MQNLHKINKDIKKKIMSYKPEYILIFGAQFNFYIIIERKKK